MSTPWLASSSCLGGRSPHSQLTVRSLRVSSSSCTGQARPDEERVVLLTPEQAEQERRLAATSLAPVRPKVDVR